MEDLKTKLLEQLKESMRKLTFVRWDRYTDNYVEGDEDSGIKVFGWIDRLDNYKDFIILETSISKHGTYLVGFTTSSASHHDVIAKILDYPKSQIVDCQRVEYLFTDLNNVVNLKLHDTR